MRKEAFVVTFLAIYTQAVEIESMSQAEAMTKAVAQAETVAEFTDYDWAKVQNYFFSDDNPKLKG